MGVYDGDISGPRCMWVFLLYDKHQNQNEARERIRPRGGKEEMEKWELIINIICSLFFMLDLFWTIKDFYCTKKQNKMLRFQNSVLLERNKMVLEVLTRLSNQGSDEEND